MDIRQVQITLRISKVNQNFSSYIGEKNQENCGASNTYYFVNNNVLLLVKNKFDIPFDSIVRLGTLPIKFRNFEEK